MFLHDYLMVCEISTVRTLTLSEVDLKANNRHFYLSMIRNAKRLDDGKQGFPAHLGEVTMHDARVQKRRLLHQFEKANVIIEIESSIDGQHKVDLW